MTATAQNKSTSIELDEGYHRGRAVIWLKFYGRYDWLARIKTLKDIRFSRNQRLWYLPDTEKAKSDFISLQIPYLSGTHEGVPKRTPINESALKHDETSISRRTTARNTVIPSTDKKDADIHDAALPVVSWTGKGFVLEMPYSKSNVNTTKSLEGAWWNAKSKKWMCKGTIPNLEKMQKFWSLWAKKESLSKVISSLDMVKKSTIGKMDSCIYNIVGQNIKNEQKSKNHNRTSN